MRVSWYQKGKTNLDLLEQEIVSSSGICWGHMQVCTSPQTDNHANILPLSFLQAGCPFCRPTNSVKAVKASAHPGSHGQNQKSRKTVVVVVVVVIIMKYMLHYTFKAGN